MNLSSGSSVRLPVMVTWVSATGASSGSGTGPAGSRVDGTVRSGPHLLGAGPAQPPAEPGGADPGDLGPVGRAGHPVAAAVGDAGDTAPAALPVARQPGVGEGQQLAAGLPGLAHAGLPRVGGAAGGAALLLAHPRRSV